VGADVRRAVVFLMGATAAGKSALALEIARRLPVEIVSVDSTQVYRGLDIGSAKPDAATQAEVPHHLVDIRDPADSYSAAAFAHDAARAIAAIHARGRIPLLVGGTMLYFKALRDGLAELPAADVAVRSAIEAEAAVLGWPAMHARLARIDPAIAARLQPMDRQRVQRALEIHLLTGELPSRLQALGSGGLAQDPRLALLQFAVGPMDRRALDAAMASRFDAMLRAGLVEEVRALLAQPGVHAALPSMRAVGYRQVCAWLDGQLATEAMRDDAVKATRDLAKRQYTWLRKWPELTWLEAGAAGVAAVEARLSSVRERTD
jgi:tRNA dimethylallyltransferase